MTDFEFALCERIRELVDQSGLKQKEIAAEAGIEYTKFNKMLRPYIHNKIPTAEDVANLARVFNVSTDYLLTGAEFGEREEQDSLERMDAHDAKTAVTALVQFMIMCPYTFAVTEGTTISKSWNGNEFIETEEETTSLTIGSMTNTINTVFKEEAQFPNNYDHSYLTWKVIIDQIDKVRQLSGFTPSQRMKMAEVIIDDQLKFMEKTLDTEGDLVWHGMNMPNLDEPTEK